MIADLLAKYVFRRPKEVTNGKTRNKCKNNVEGLLKSELNISIEKEKKSSNEYFTINKLARFCYSARITVTRNAEVYINEPESRNDSKEKVYPLKGSLSFIRLEQPEVLLKCEPCLTLNDLEIVEPKISFTSNFKPRGSGERLPPVADTCGPYVTANCSNRPSCPMPYCPPSFGPPCLSFSSFPPPCTAGCEPQSCHTGCPQYSCGGPPWGYNNPCSQCCADCWEACEYCCEICCNSCRPSCYPPADGCDGYTEPVHCVCTPV